jgi:hypothetical protein
MELSANAYTERQSCGTCLLNLDLVKETGNENYILDTYKMRAA